MCRALWPSGRRRGLRLATSPCPSGRGPARPRAAPLLLTSSGRGQRARGLGRVSPRGTTAKPQHSTAPVVADMGRRPPPAAETGYADTHRGEPPHFGEVSGECQYHEWHWQGGRWLCVRCLASARTGVPRRQKCPGASPSIRGLLEDPKGHKFQIATFVNGFGIVVICSGCGHFVSSNRRGPLHKNSCLAKGGQQAFASPSARAAYQRVCEGKHPTHAKYGEAKVLDACVSAAALLALARGGGQPTQGPHPP